MRCTPNYVIMRSRIEGGIVAGSQGTPGKWKSETLVSPATGELFDEVLIRRKPRFPLKAIGGSFIVIFAQGWQRIKAAKLTGLESRLMFELMTVLHFRRWTVIEVKSVAMTLGSSREETSRALKRLVEASIIERGNKVGLCYEYRLDADIGWYGDGEEWTKWQIERGRFRNTEQLEMGYAN